MKKIIHRGKEVETDFNFILEEFRPMMYKFMWQYNNIKLDEEEYFQNLMIYTWKAYKTYNIEKGVEFSTYLYTGLDLNCRTLLRNTVRDFYKSSVETESIDRPINDGEAKTIMDLLIVKDTDLDNVFNSIIVKRLIQSLEGEERLMVELYLDGYNYKEIGTLLGSSQQAMHQKFQRVWNKLRIIHKILFEVA